MKSKKIRPIALCVFHFKNKILVSKGYDRVKKQHFYRPLGGKINFSEPAMKTVEREFLEELNLRVKNLKYLGTVENIFIYNGNQGHEIALIYDGEFIPKEVYNEEKLARCDGIDTDSYAQWVPLNKFYVKPETFSDSKVTPLYPSGLLKLLRTSS